MDLELLLPDLAKEMSEQYFLIWDKNGAIINLPIPESLKVINKK